MLRYRSEDSTGAATNRNMRENATLGEDGSEFARICPLHRYRHRCRRDAEPVTSLDKVMG